MALKNCSVSLELRCFRALNKRMGLSADEKIHYSNLEKGFQGELMFDRLTVKLLNDVIVINDLCLEFNNTIFQIDTLIISQDIIYPFEVKNFEGDFYYDSDSFKTVYNKEILNPLDQLKRSKILLQQLLRSMGFQLQLEGFVVFVNPEFTLYQAPLNAPIIFPSQLNRFMKKLENIPSQLNDRQKKIAAQLVSMHRVILPYEKLPSHTYEELKKDIICSVCFSFMAFDGDKKLICENCGCEENINSAILRSVEEIKLLFPDKKITTNCVHEWCGVIESKKIIRRVLKENYRKIRSDRWTYFE